MYEKILRRTKNLAAIFACIAICIAGFNFLIVRQDRILKRYFIQIPKEKLKEYQSSLAQSLSKYFVRENRSSDIASVAEYLRRHGRTPLFQLYFIYQAPDGRLQQIGKAGTVPISADILSNENVFPVSVNNGNVEGYLLVDIEKLDSAELQEGYVKYRIISYSIRLIFLLLVTALLVIVLYHDYSAKMRLARDLAEIKASYDGLTGLHTHEYFMRILDLEVRKARITKMPLAIFMLDIDFFKKFNDTYGHQAGDKVLEEVSKIVKVSTRASDVLGRYGGEEFAVIIPYVTKDQDTISAEESLKNFSQEISALAERVRVTVEEDTVSYGESALKVTVSIGVALYHPSSFEIAPTLLLERADKALYAAKHAGRNRVCIFED